jgi:hypothetical protein
MHRYPATAALLLAVAFVGYMQPSHAANNGPSASYSKAQAEHGKVLYTQNCSKCHLENLKGNCPGENLSESAYVCSPRGTAPPLTGAMFIRRFYTIADLSAEFDGPCPEITSSASAIRIAWISWPICSRRTALLLERISRAM